MFILKHANHEAIPKHAAMPLMFHVLPCGNIARQSNDFEMTVYFATHDLFLNKYIIDIYTSYVNLVLQVVNNDKNATLVTTLADMEHQTPF